MASLVAADHELKHVTANDQKRVGFSLHIFFPGPHQWMMCGVYVHDVEFLPSGFAVFKLGEGIGCHPACCLAEKLVQRSS